MLSNLTKDELFLICNKLNLPNILNLSICNKKMYNDVCRSELWSYKLKNSPDYEKLNHNKKSKKDIYKLLCQLKTLKTNYTEKLKKFPKKFVYFPN